MSEYSLKEWFRIQGYDIEILPPTITWYRPDFVKTNMFKPYRGARVATWDGTPSAHRGRLTSDSFLHNAKTYRGLGLVVNPKFLYRGYYETLQRDEDTTIHNEETDTPIVTKPKEIDNTTPRLAQAIMALMAKQDIWLGTPTALLSELGSRGGLPKSAGALSGAIVQSNIERHLQGAGLTIVRKRTHTGRLICIERHS